MKGTPREKIVNCSDFGIETWSWRGVECGGVLDFMVEGDVFVFRPLGLIYASPDRAELRLRV